MKLKIILIIALLVMTCKAFTQNSDTLKHDEKDKSKKEYITRSFASTRVIMSQSLEMLRPGILDFRILHRFGNINQGPYQSFGLDQATLRLGLDYGLTSDLSIGIGRSNYKKELDGFIKYRPVRQSSGPNSMPYSLITVIGSTLNTMHWSDPSRKNFFSSRLGYYGQVIVGRKFNESLTLQLAPLVVHQNLVVHVSDPNDLYAVGLGARIRLSKRTSLNADYYFALNRNAQLTNFYNPFSIGFDIETGGHVFQLHFTNAIGMNERAFLTETTNNWAKGDIQLGFNISRSFQILKKKN